jgi:hypothetical protein
LLLFEDLAMILTSNTRLTDWIAEWLGRRLARYLAQPVKDFVPLATANPGAFLRALRPGDIVLVEGNTRVSTAIKYLTQSTWSHSSLYVGPISGRSEPSGEPHVLVEADVEHGVLSAPASKYSSAHTRICRPVGLSADEIRVVTNFAVDRIGLAYDLRNTFDLLRYLLPTPPVPSRFRRRMIALGAGSPTRAICSTLIAQAFQTIDYPILPPVEDIASGQVDMASAGLEGAHELAHIRHYSLFAPRDFDISPYFMVVKPTVDACFNPHSVKWGSEKARIEGEQSALLQGHARYLRGMSTPTASGALSDRHVDRRLRLGS